VNTSNTNKESSLETDISPTILIAFNNADNSVSAGYTFGLTYYDRAPTGNGGGLGGGSNSQLQYSHSLVASEAHQFSERFGLNVAEQFQYSIEPNIYQSVGTSFQNGAYYSNTLSGSFTAQWTPLFGTTTTYGNTIVRYANSSVSNSQDSLENTASQSAGWAILPKISLNVGGIYDDVTYTEAFRGYSNYTLFAGTSWEALPALSISARGGGSYIEPAEGKASTAPYGDLSVSWTLGARSSLHFDYSHEVTPTDQVGAQAQTADRFTTNFLYSITPRFSASLLAAYTSSQVQQNLTNGQAPVSPNEQVYDLEPELIFHYNSYLDLNAGIGYSGNSSQISDRNYERTQVYVGVRGTY
jgi:hypothetical protein